MQYIAAFFALVAAVAANGHAGDYNYAAAYRHAHSDKHGMAHNYSAPAAPPAHVYVTEVVTELTTVCPYATKLTIGEKTYTVTEATTLTITDCPCTISHKVPAPSAAAGTGYAPPVAPSVSAPYPTGRPTNCTGSTSATATGPAATHAAPPQYTGAASKAGIALLGLAGAGLAALL